MRKLCEWKGVNIVEAECCPEHIHMSLEIPLKMSYSEFGGYLKGKNSLMIFESFPHLRYKFSNRHFWYTGYFVSTEGVNESTIIKYVREQKERDKITDQYSFVVRQLVYEQQEITLQQESR